MISFDILNAGHYSSWPIIQ